MAQGNSKALSDQSIGFILEIEAGSTIDDLKKAEKAYFSLERAVKKAALSIKEDTDSMFESIEKLNEALREMGGASGGPSGAEKKVGGGGSRSKTKDTIKNAEKKIHDHQKRQKDHWKNTEKELTEIRKNTSKGPSKDAVTPAVEVDSNGQYRMFEEMWDDIKKSDNAQMPNNQLFGTYTPTLTEKDWDRFDKNREDFLEAGGVRPTKRGFEDPSEMDLSQALAGIGILEATSKVSDSVKDMISEIRSMATGGEEPAAQYKGKSNAESIVSDLMDFLERNRPNNAGGPGGPGRPLRGGIPLGKGYNADTGAEEPGAWGSMMSVIPQEFAQKIDTVRTSIGATRKAMGALSKVTAGASVAMITAFAGVATAIGTAVFHAAQFQDTMIKVRKMTAATGDQLRRMKDAVLDLSIATGMASDDIAIVAATLRQKGGFAEAEEGFREITEISVKMGEILTVNANEMAEFMATTTVAFRMGVDEADDFAASLIQIQRQGGIAFEELRDVIMAVEETMRRTSLQGEAMRKAVVGIGAAGQVFAQNYGSADAAAEIMNAAKDFDSTMNTQLRRLMQESGEGIDIRALSEAMDTQEGQIDVFERLSESVKNFKASAEGMDMWENRPQQVQELFGLSQNALNALADAIPGEFRKAFEEANKQGGLKQIHEEFNEMKGTLSSLKDRVLDVMETIAVYVGKPLLDPLAAALKGILFLFQNLVAPTLKFISALATIVSPLTGIKILIEKFKEFKETLFKSVPGLELYMKAVEKVRDAFRMLGDLMSAVFDGDLDGANEIAAKFSETFIEAISEVPDHLISILEQLPVALESILSGSFEESFGKRSQLLSTLTATFVKAWAVFEEKMPQVIAALVKNLPRIGLALSKIFFKTAIAFSGAMAKLLIKALAGIPMFLVKKIASAIAQIPRLLGRGLGAAVRVLEDAFVNLRSYIKGLWPRLVEGLKGLGPAIVESLKSAGSDLYQFFKDLATSFAGYIKNSLIDMIPGGSLLFDKDSEAGSVRESVAGVAGSAAEGVKGMASGAWDKISGALNPFYEGFEQGYSGPTVEPVPVAGAAAMDGVAVAPGQVQGGDTTVITENDEQKKQTDALYALVSLYQEQLRVARGEKSKGPEFGAEHSVPTGDQYLAGAW